MREGVDVPREGLLAPFLDDLALAGKSPKTIQTYRSLLRTLPAPLTAITARRHLSDAIQSGKQPASVLTLYGAMCSFANWCVLQGYLAESPMRGIPSPRPKEKPHRYLSAVQVRAVYAVCKDDDERLIVLLLLEGLRAAELLALRWQDVGEDRITVAFGKGGRVRAIPLTPAVTALLAGHERVRGRILRFSQKTLQNRLSALGERARVPHLHAHLFRHTWASLSLVEGIDELSLRTLGGWSPTSKVMERYLRSVREDAAIKRAGELGLSERLLGDHG